MKLFDLTPEGRIVFALVEGMRSYSELRRLTGLSERWLSIKLRDLEKVGVIERRGRRYILRRPEIVSKDPLASAYLRFKGSPPSKAKFIAEELKRNGEVLAIVLFGGVAKGVFDDESDLDLLIITEGGVEPHEEVYRLSFKYSTPIEAIFMSFEELLSHVIHRTALILGVVEGYEVLYDRVGAEKILSYLEERAKREFIYDMEAGAWIGRSGPILRQP